MFDELFAPIKIGPVEIKNRVAMAPMNGQGDREGHPTLQYICFHTARALGGFGLLTTGSILTSKVAHEEYPIVPYLYPGSFNAGYWFDFVEGIHSMATDTKIVAQLSPGPGFGRQIGRKGVRSPSGVPFTAHGLYEGQTKETLPWTNYWIKCWTDYLVKVPREMTIDEIKKDVRSFVLSAELAVLAGFDGIEPHGYMLHQFLSPRTNQRTDEYGGSLRNRARFLLEIVAACKGDFGDAVPIVVRLSGREYQEGGLSAEDVREVAKWCEQAGADAISLSNGSGWDDSKHFFPTTHDNLELLEAQGRKLKEVIGIPVITVGLHTPAVAANAVKNGETDLIAMGRQAIADPEWPNKVKEGRIKDILRCNKDMYCLSTANFGGQGSMRCTQNRNYGKEQYMQQYWPKPMKGRVPETLRRWRPGLKWQKTNEAWQAFQNRVGGNSSAE